MEYTGGCRDFFNGGTDAACAVDENGCISFGGKTVYSYRKMNAFYNERGQYVASARIALDSLLENNQAVIFHRARTVPVWLTMPGQCCGNPVDIDYYALTDAQWDLERDAVRVGSFYTKDTVCVLRVDGRYYFGTSIQSPHDKYEKAYGNAMAFDRALASVNIDRGIKKPKKLLREIERVLSAPDVLPEQFRGSYSQPTATFDSPYAFGTYFIDRVAPRLIDIDFEDIEKLTESLITMDVVSG